MSFCSFHERVNDCVLKVNNTDLTNVEYCTAVQAISRGDVINMVSEIVDAVNYNKYNFKALLLAFSIFVSVVIQPYFIFLLFAFRL